MLRTARNHLEACNEGEAEQSDTRRDFCIQELVLAKLLTRHADGEALPEPEDWRTVVSEEDAAARCGGRGRVVGLQSFVRSPSSEPDVGPCASLLRGASSLHHACIACYSLPDAPPTNPALELPETRPYFLWWTNATVADFRAKLASSDPAEQAYWMGALLREANTRDVWLFVTPQQIRSAWPSLLRHLGRRRELWGFLLDLASTWPPRQMSVDHAG